MQYFGCGLHVEAFLNKQSIVDISFMPSNNPENLNFGLWKLFCFLLFY